MNTQENLAPLKSPLNDPTVRLNWKRLDLRSWNDPRETKPYYDNSVLCGECTGSGCKQCQGTGVVRWPLFDAAKPPAIARITGPVRYLVHGASLYGGSRGRKISIQAFYPYHK